MRTDCFDHLRSDHSPLIGRRFGAKTRYDRAASLVRSRPQGADLAPAALLTLENAAHAERMELGGAQCVDAGAAMDMDALRHRPAKNMSRHRRGALPLGVTAID